MITTHAVAPAPSTADARNRRACSRLEALFLLAVAAITGLYFLALNRQRQRHDAEREAEADDIAADLVMEFTAAIAAQRGTCACPEPIRCEQSRCILCHRCHGAIDAPRRADGQFDANAPGYREMADAHRRVIMGDDPNRTLPLVRREPELRGALWMAPPNPPGDGKPA